jgi:hypothetical protein
VQGAQHSNGPGAASRCHGGLVKPAGEQESPRGKLIRKHDA